MTVPIMAAVILEHSGATLRNKIGYLRSFQYRYVSLDVFVSMGYVGEEEAFRNDKD
jgi:hypothetical protein